MEVQNQKPLTFSDFIVTVKGWFFFLLRRWKLILLAALIGGIVGVLKEQYTKPKYLGRLSFALEDNTGSLGTAASLAAEFGLSIGSSQSAFSGDNIIQILSSRNMVERTLLSVDSSLPKPQSLLNYYLSKPGLGKGLTKYKRFSGITIPEGTRRESFSYLQDSLLYAVYQKIIKANLSAFKPDKKLSIYEVTCNSQDEWFSKHFIEQLVKETSAFYTELKTKRSLQTLLILQRRVDSLKGSLNRSLGSRAASQDANINPVFSSAQVPSQKAQVDITTFAGAYEELFKNLELARYQFQKDVPLLQVIDEPRFPLQRIKGGRLSTGILFSFVTVLLMVAVLVLMGNPSIRETKPETPANGVQ